MKTTSLFSVLVLIATMAQANEIPVELVTPGRVNPELQAEIERQQAQMRQQRERAVTKSQGEPANVPLSRNAKAELNTIINSVENNQLATTETFQQAQTQQRPSHFQQMLDKAYRPKQKLDLKPGDNMVIPVAAGMLNWIKSNYQSVAVRTHSEETIISVEGGNIYFTINTLEPVSLLIGEEGVPDSAINLTLVPAEMKPPVVITANVDLDADIVARGQAYQRELEKERLLAEAQASESASPMAAEHENRIKAILKDVGLGQIPAGFQLSYDVADALPRPCSVTLSQRVGQRLIGTREVIDVVAISNNSSRPYNVTEEACLSRDTIAVAIYQSGLLQPGEVTEIYILRQKQRASAELRKQRPRLTGGQP